MKRIILSLAIMVIAATSVFGQSKDEQEIRKTLNAVADALNKNDMAALSDYYADSYTLTDSEGKTSGKAERLELIKNTKREAFSYGDMNIRTFENAAVVIANPSFAVIGKDGQKFNIKDRATLTLIKNGGRWQIAAVHTTSNLLNLAGGNAEQEIRQTLDKLADALTRRDADAASNYWADNWTFIGRNGEMVNKTQRLASLKSGQPRPGVFKYEDVNIRLLGPNTAVVLARPTYPIKFDNGQTVTVSDRATMTMAKMNGRWQIVATQTTWDNPDTGDNAAVEKQISEILANWGNAIGRRDTAAIEKILAPNAMMVYTPDGKILNREQYLETMKNLPGKAAVSGKSEKVMVQGDTAVSTGTYSVTPEGGQTTNYKYTATFVRRAGGWYPVTFYSGMAGQK